MTENLSLRWFILWILMPSFAVILTSHYWYKFHVYTTSPFCDFSFVQHTTTKPIRLQTPIKDLQKMEPIFFQVTLQHFQRNRNMALKSIWTKILVLRREWKTEQHRGRRGGYTWGMIKRLRHVEKQGKEWWINIFEDSSYSFQVTQRPPGSVSQHKISMVNFVLRKFAVGI